MDTFPNAVGIPSPSELSGSKLDDKTEYITVFYPSFNNTAKCECGAEKTYGPNTNFHSSWCPKYTDERKDET